MKLAERTAVIGRGWTWAGFFFHIKGLTSAITVFVWELLLRL